MLTKIVAKLKTGSIKNVVPFGSALPAGRYVVVKPESGPNETRRFRIIPHVAQGEQITLENYLFNEVSTLLSGFQSTDRHGNNFKVLDTGEWTDIVAENDDSTISMERVFYVPQKLY